MKFPPDIRVFGDVEYRGDCPNENVEQVTFFARIRRKYPETWGRLALHPRNEGKRTHLQMSHQKAEGMTPGASDIVIPGSPAFVCELKRRDHTKSSWQEDQEEYLRVAQQMGSFACVALGVDAAEEAFNEYLEWREASVSGDRRSAVG